MPVEVSLNLEHLQAELNRIDQLIQRQVQRWQLAGRDSTDAFLGLHISDVEANNLLARPFATSWGQTVTPTETLTQAEDSRLTKQWVEVASPRPRLAQLAATFGLTPFELDALLVCLAPALDLRYERLYSYLQDDVTRKRPTVNLILDLLAEAGPTRLLRLAHFADHAPLFNYYLLQREVESGPDKPSLLNQPLSADETIVAWLLGRYQPNADLGAHARLLMSASASPNNRLPAGPLWSELSHLAELGAGDPPVIVFYGPDRVCQEEAAMTLAAQSGRSLLMVDLAAVIKMDLSPQRALHLALRDARLTGALAYLSGWDACLAPEGHLPPELLAELCAYPDEVIVAGQTQWQAEGIERNRFLYWLEFPIPTYLHRLELWQYFVKNSSQISDASSQIPVASSQPAVGGDAESPIDLDTLAGQFALTTGQIRDAVASARDIAVQRGDAAMQLPDLFASARAYSNPRLAALARKITPRYDWPDLILPPDQLAILQEMVASVRGRPLVLDQWGVGRKLASSAAVMALFAGDPGTGKTMAAEVMAAELGLDMYKIDLSTVISKYIGETEKNLERIFSEAESSNAILFFDEADSIFGKRSEVKDAHDRYANIEISYLLQRMEAYDGVTILATNLRANLDDAFTRRLQFLVDFPFPDADYRLRIWQTLFPPDVPHEPQLDFTFLANRFKLAGGNIRNIIVGATYLAAADGGQVTMNHLLHSTRREMQKMGRLVNEADLRLS